MAHNVWVPAEGGPLRAFTFKQPQMEITITNVDYPLPPRLWQGAVTRSLHYVFVFHTNQMQIVRTPPAPGDSTWRAGSIPLLPHHQLLLTRIHVLRRNRYAPLILH